MLVPAVANPTCQHITTHLGGCAGVGLAHAPRPALHAPSRLRDCSRHAGCHALQKQRASYNTHRSMCCCTAARRFRAPPVHRPAAPPAAHLGGAVCQGITRLVWRQTLAVSKRLAHCGSTGSQRAGPLVKEVLRSGVPSALPATIATLSRQCTFEPPCLHQKWRLPGSCSSVGRDKGSCWACAKTDRIAAAQAALRRRHQRRLTWSCQPLPWTTPRTAAGCGPSAPWPASAPRPVGRPQAGRRAGHLSCLPFCLQGVVD